MTRHPMSRRFGLVSGVYAAVACVGAATAQNCGPQWLNGAMPALNGTAYAAVTWDPDGPGPLPPALVVGGSFTLAGNVPVSNLALWNGVQWSDVGGGVSGTLHGPTAVRALAVMPDGDLIVAGAFDAAGAGGTTAAACIARFDGAAWSRMQSGTPQAASTVTKLGVRPNGDLIALGGLFFNDDNSICGPLVKWNDADSARWSDLAASSPNLTAYRTFTVLSNGDVVAGGVAGDDPANSAIWRWSGASGSWTGFGSGVTGPDQRRQVLSILEAGNGDIIAAGNFTTAGGTAANSIARWNGSSWLPYGSGITYPAQPFRLGVYALAQMPNGDIIAGGEFDTAGGNTGGRIARWDGANWARLSQGAGDIIWSLIVTPHEELIIAGAYTFAGGSFANKRASRFIDVPAPWVALPPAPRTVASGDTVTLSAAAATGFANVNFRWQRDGVDLSDGPGGASPGGGTVSGGSGALASPTTGATITLTITAAQPSDSGDYRVIFSNACGADSAVAAVVIAGPVCPADFNGDGFLDFFDYDAYVECFESGTCPDGRTADFNGDEFVDFFDYDDFVAAFEEGC